MWNDITVYLSLRKLCDSKLISQKTLCLDRFDKSLIHFRRSWFLDFTIKAECLFPYDLVKWCIFTKSYLKINIRWNKNYTPHLLIEQLSYMKNYSQPSAFLYIWWIVSKQVIRKEFFSATPLSVNFNNIILSYNIQSVILLVYGNKYFLCIQGV